MLILIDEYTRDSLAIRVASKLRSIDVIETLTDAMFEPWIPEHIRSDNGPEFVAFGLQLIIHQLSTGHARRNRANNAGPVHLVHNFGLDATRRARTDEILNQRKVGFRTSMVLGEEPNRRRNSDGQ